jgi:hypothetical protein
MPPPDATASPLARARRAAASQGIPAAAAMIIQVTALMPMRTVTNYQYRTGVSLSAAYRTLRADGFRRFYAGYSAAIFQAPLSRLGDTAANAATFALLDSAAATADLPIPVKTAVASTAAAAFRIALMPIDAVKTTLQAHGSANGLAILRAKLRTAGTPAPLFHGALGASAATLVGHYPWFVTYNTLTAHFPAHPDESLAATLGRAAAIGFTASAVSDTTSNALRVVKTVRQTGVIAESYPTIIRKILAEQGPLKGLFGRGLPTRIATNGIQGLMFSVLWRIGQDAYNRPTPKN